MIENIIGDLTSTYQDNKRALLRMYEKDMEDLIEEKKLFSSHVGGSLSRSLPDSRLFTNYHFCS